MRNENILEVSHLCKQYPSFRLNDVSFAIPRGYIMGFVGPNGAGKTTTIKSILGMVSPDSGGTSLFGGQGDFSQVTLREDVGIVLDNSLFAEHWRVSEVEDVMAPFYRNWDSDRYSQLCENFLLHPKAKVKDLSRGMKVKLMMAVAVSHGAKLLILDEPTSGLDPVARDDLLELLQEFIQNEDCGVLFSTHITSDLEKVADYITYIQKGSIVFTGEKDELMSKYLLVRGGPEDLTPPLRKKLLGLREYGMGFEGMLETQHASVLSPGAEESPITLDQILVFMNRGEEHE